MSRLRAELTEPLTGDGRRHVLACAIVAILWLLAILVLTLVGAAPMWGWLSFLLFFGAYLAIQWRMVRKFKEQPDVNAEAKGKSAETWAP